MNSGIESIKKWMENEKIEIESRIRERMEIVRRYIERRDALLDNIKILRESASSEVRASINKKMRPVEMQELNQYYHESISRLRREIELMDNKIETTNSEISKLEEELTDLKKKMKSIEKYMNRLSLKKKSKMQKREDRESQDYFMAGYEGKQHLS